MSMSMRYVDSDKVEVMLGTLTQECAKAGLDTQKEAAKVVKREVIRRLQSIRTTDEKIKHMCDDVQIATSEDQYGDTIVKVQGGKSTGTLWHIVNDGTYRTDATHFMDLALNSVESDLEKLVDQELKKVFE